MTMPKFEPVGWLGDENCQPKFISSAPCQIEEELYGPFKPLHTAEQLAEAYEAGKLDAIPEPMTLPPLYPDESREEQFGLMNYARGWNACRAAMLAAAPKGEE